MRFISKSVLLASLLTVSALTRAQDSNQVMPPNYRGVHIHVGGIFVTPLPNFPFSADVEIISHERLPDGTERVLMTTTHIARASSGVIYSERRRLVPPGFQGKPRLVSALIYDPSSRQSIVLMPSLHLARETTLRAPERTPNNALPPQQQPKIDGVTETDLGTQSLNGLELHGIRKQRTIPGQMSGTGQPVVITDDYWYSPDLAIYATIRHDDPRTGEQLVSLTNLDRHEPPAETFAVPPDYKVVDETTPDAPHARQ